MTLAATITSANGCKSHFRGVRPGAAFTPITKPYAVDCEITWQERSAVVASRLAQLEVPAERIVGRGDLMRNGTRCLAPLVLSVLLVAAPKTPIRRLDGSMISPTDIDTTVRRLMDAAEVTGAGIAILRNGRVAFLKAYGFRDAEKKLPLTQDSVMAGASFTKAAFSYLVMQMVASKAIDLDKPVEEYLPKPIPDYDAYKDLSEDRRYKKITARMLLSHTSGFPNLRFLNPDRKLNINFEPGSRYAYSGEGIQLLQLVVETITAKPLQETMRERVFCPLRMSRTSMVTEQRFQDNHAN